MARRAGINKRNARESARKETAQRRMAVQRTLLWALVALGCISGAGIAAIELTPRLLAKIKSSSTFVVKTIEVRQTAHVSRDEALKHSGLRIGMPMAHVKPRSIERQLQTILWVKKAQVIRKLPATVRIAITERVPVALIGNGRIFFVDETGVVLPMGAGEHAELPLIQGLTDSHDGSASAPLPAASIRRFMMVWRGILQADKQLERQVTQLQFAQNGALRLKIASMRAAIEMHEERLAEGCAHLRKLMPVLESETDAAPHVINLSYRNCAFVR